MLLGFWRAIAAVSEFGQIGSLAFLSFYTPAIAMPVVNFNILKARVFQESNGFMLSITFQIGGIQLIVNYQPPLFGGHGPPNFINVLFQWER